MKTTLAFLAAGLLSAAPAWAQDDAEPNQPAPAEAPPPPGANLPPPPSDPDAAVTADEAPPPATGAAPDGQWTYTQQYGWVYTPYAQSYTHVGDNGEVAFTYAYYPTYGWRWLPSPWVLGWGPRPYWGHYGYSRFAWYGHPWFHAGVYRPNVWTRWGHGWGHGYVYAHGYGHVYERGAVRPHYGARVEVRGGRGGHGGGWHRR